MFSPTTALAPPPLLTGNALAVPGSSPAGPYTGTSRLALHDKRVDICAETLC